MIFALNACPLILAIVIYVKWIRPTIRNLPHIKNFYDETDSIWQHAFLWVRVQWDAIVSCLLIVWPQVPDILQQISGTDMSALIPTTTTKVINQVIGVTLIAFKALTLARTKTPS